MSLDHSADRRYMRQALRLAERARGRTSPNPMVGAVVVKDGVVVGQGFHLRAGTAHGEIAALTEAGLAARGADLYVNLEPCNHVGRTGPCAQAIISAGIRRVVVGMQDPNPLVNGKGIQALREAGVLVETGLLTDEARRLNEAFVCTIERGRPHVTFKSALTLDGRVATRTGDSRWVTGERARHVSHGLRNSHDAILVGVGTVLRDDPTLTCRGVRNGRDPVRVIVDSRLRTPPGAAVVKAARASDAPTFVVGTHDAEARAEQALTEAGARVLRVQSDGGHVLLPALLAALLGLSVSSVLLEGGPTLAGAFFRQRLVDRVLAMVAPKILGDPGALPMLAGGEALAMADAVPLHVDRVRQLGDDLMLDARVLWPGSEER